MSGDQHTSEPQPPPTEPGSAQPDDADEAALIRKVLRAQERHREGGIDPELDEDAAGRAGGRDGGGEHPGE